MFPPERNLNNYNMLRGILLSFISILLFISCKKDGPSTPQLSSTTIVVDKSNNSVTLTAKVISESGSATKERGFCWGTSPNPSVSDAKVSNEYGIGEYSYTLSNLQLSTTYYVRAFATNSIGTSYGKEVSFKSLSSGKFSLVKITDTAINSAKVNISIEDFGNSNIFSQGLCYSTKPFPTIKDTNKVEYKNVIDKNYSIEISKLKRGTKYYVRAYVISGVGVFYSDEVFFTTKPTLPVISTKTATNIFSKKAFSGVTIADDGGIPLLDWGICLSGKVNPDINDRVFKGNLNNVIDLVTLINLKFDSTYFIRAYARNALGLVYGQELNFKTVYQVGEVGPAGGFIFYDKGAFSDNWRYLEAAPKDTIDCNVGCYNINIITDSAIGMGIINTKKIIDLMCPESNVAAYVASKYELNGFKDWFLPSFKELNQFIISNKDNLYNVKSTSGLLPYYVSSTMLGKVDVAMISPKGLTGNSLGRKFLFYIRPVRRF